MNTSNSTNIQRALDLFSYFDAYEGKEEGLTDFSDTELVAATLGEMGVAVNIVTCDWVDQDGVERDAAPYCPVAIEVDGQLMNSMGTRDWQTLIDEAQEARGAPERFAGILRELVMINYIAEAPHHDLKSLVKHTAGWRFAKEDAAELEGETAPGAARPKNGPRL